MLIGDPENSSVIHILQWGSHLSQRPVRSIASGEVLAVGSAIDKGKILSRTFSKLFKTYVPLSVVVDSKDLFTSLSTCCIPEDKTIRADLELLRYHYETHHLEELIWVPGSVNLADPLIKRDSPLSIALQLMIFDVTLPVSLVDAEMRT